MLTHTVVNQAPPRVGINEFATNIPLVEAVRHYDAEWALQGLEEIGALVGTANFQTDAETANINVPTLATHDRYGHRIDEVHYDTSYHRIIAQAVAHGVHTSAWADPKPGANVARAAGFMLFAQIEPGHACPISMTHSAVPTLRVQPDLAQAWLPRLYSREYDSELGAHKPGALIGMAMTEKQGGSDVRANTTRAVQQADGSYEVVGHKWFFSAPMCDAWLVLAYGAGSGASGAGGDVGLSCFLMPKLRPDGSRNAIHIQRLKDKLGDWSNASSEVEFHGAWAQLVGKEGRGVATILEMVALTRQDCMIGSSALMRQALAQALHHARHRRAFGKPLAEQPLMQNVLADLALESEAALAFTLR
ncbi:MAG: acyl-CoA dehydrogenase family protein, partial [Terrimesophilobacter sp.]